MVYNHKDQENPKIIDFLNNTIPGLLKIKHTFIKIEIYFFLIIKKFLI